MLNKEFLRNRLAFIRQGSEVERFHTKRMIQRNDVGHHSFHVAWLAYLLALGDAGSWKENNADPHKVVMAALAHDLAESITGDMPGDFKREAGIRDQFSAYERERFWEVGLEFEEGLTEAERRCLKFADMLEGAFFCVSEASLGNARIGEVFRNYRGYIEGFAPFNQTEAAIVEYVDELWRHYGVDDAPAWGRTAHSEQSVKEESIMGQEEVRFTEADRLAVEKAFPPVRQESVYLGILRKEEAEGRATPPICFHAREEFDGPNDRVRCKDCGMVRHTEAGNDESNWYDPSKAAVLGGTPAPNQPQDEPVDDVAERVLGPKAHLPANARQHGGDHYKGVGYEHWDLVLDTGMNYFQGCATKYVTRARKHEAGCRLNILKAIHYVDKLDEAVAAERITPANSTYSTDAVADFKAANQLNDLEARIIGNIIAWRLNEARSDLHTILGECPEDAARPE